jgi:hypothetical protein
MRYISVYSKSSVYRKIFTILQVVILAVPAIMILFTFVFLAMLGKNMPTIPFQFWMAIAMMVMGAVAAYGFVRFMLQRLISVSVEVSSMGIHHLAPGKEKTIQWYDVTAVKRVAYSKSTQALRIITSNSYYTFPPHLIPDTPDAPQLKFGFLRQVWHYPNGRTEPFDIEHSFGWQIIKSYRPDLLPK